MKKSAIKKMPEYFDRYINLTDDVSYTEALQISLQELESAPLEKWKALGNKVYAKDKWTVKDILQHFIDTERVFTYRILAIARGDKQKMIPYDEEAFAKNTIANQRTIDDLLSELILVRKGTIAMFQSFTPDMLQQLGNGFNGMQYCPLSLGFMLAGHQRWHFNVLEDKYFPMLKIVD
jgi:DinB superfamily